MRPCSTYVPVCRCLSRSVTDIHHNLPPAEANKGRRKLRGTPPRPRQEASPPAPLLYDWMSGLVRATFQRDNQGLRPRLQNRAFTVKKEQRRGPSPGGSCPSNM